MEFEKIAIEYMMTFNEQPPILTTLDTDDELYLNMLKKAIKTKKPLTRNDLADVFMTNDKVLY